MKKTFQVAAVTLSLVSQAHAQDAVQWRVEDGGNGHWYQWVHRISGVSWMAARDACVGAGGHLATPTSTAENEFVFGLTLPTSLWPYRFGPWLGGYQDLSAVDYSEPAGGWRWVTDETWAWSAWWPGEPSNHYCVTPGEDKLHYIDYQPMWNDITNLAGECEQPNWSYIIEWSADCNNDGVVDYGQCHDGTLADYNGNNIPDCCEQGTPCMVGSYPVQWRVSEGGNGHWYGISIGYTGWTTARVQALALGGDLASLSTDSEWMWARGWLPSILHGYWLGGRQQPNSATPSGGWFWLTGEPVQTEWMIMDDNPCGASPPGVEDMQQDFLHSCCESYPQGRSFGDLDDFGGWGCDIALRSLVEWSADCNNDGIVDKGQILQGQLVDSDQNGVPDVCEVDPCPGDITNGGTVDAIDLSILLSAWGTSGQGEFDADADNNGIVDGGDLALVLGGWGPCPQ